MSTGPSASTSADTAVSTCAASETSAAATATDPPTARTVPAASSSTSARRAISDTRAPRSTASRAVASPIPLDPPVTSTCASEKLTTHASVRRRSGLEQPDDPTRCDAQPDRADDHEVRHVDEQEPLHLAEHQRAHQHHALVQRRHPDHGLEPGRVLRDREERRREQEERHERDVHVVEVDPGA